MFRAVAALFCVLLVVPASFAEEKPTSKVEGTFNFPKDVASFNGRLLEIRLYKYDPRLADKPADLVEKIELKDFKHVNGTETKKAFVIGAKAELETDRNYYLTFFVLDGNKRTHMGKCEHDKNGIGKVLTNGNPAKVVAEFAEIK